jgi:cytochrome c-type biogenesis protein CcmH
MKANWLWLLMLALAAALFFTSPALAQDPQPTPDTSKISDDQVNAIAKQMYCPVCENIPLGVCPTQACAQWRDLIRLRLAEGRTEAQIKAEFVEQYGDRVLATPPAQGFNWLVYLIPPLAILAGGYILFRTLKGMQQTPAPVQPPPASPAASGDASPDDYVRRLEEELRKR